MSWTARLLEYEILKERGCVVFSIYIFHFHCNIWDGSLHGMYALKKDLESDWLGLNPSSAISMRLI